MRAPSILQRREMPLPLSDVTLSRPNEAVAKPPEEQKAEKRKGMATAVATASSRAAQPPAGGRLHTNREASLLVMDTALHDWLVKRQTKSQAPKPRTFMTKHRRETLRRAFLSIDRDGSGCIDKGELCFALAHLGLNQEHAAELFLEGDSNGDGEISLKEFYALVAKLDARERQRESLKRLQPQRSAASEADRTMADLVDRAGAFPIGLLANAHKISTIVEQFDPDQYAKRAAKEDADAAKPSGAANRLKDAIGRVQAKGTAVRAMAEERAAGLSRLPRVSLTERARSAPPIKSNAHSRWLQRGATFKAHHELLGQTPAAAAAAEGASGDTVPVWGSSKLEERARPSSSGPTSPEKHARRKHLPTVAEAGNAVLPLAAAATLPKISTSARA
jgi:hypothetical protein